MRMLRFCAAPCGPRPSLPIGPALTKAAKQTRLRRTAVRSITGIEGCGPGLRRLFG